MAPKSTTVTRSFKSGRAVPKRVTNGARHTSSASESSGGVSSNSAAIAAAGSCWGTTCAARSAQVKAPIKAVEA
ncbi:hypothetical protein AQI88_41630 [Streptomyces cellostaticus]|uniref:Uncharacterized protein n=1 Tax=Streptomyces cellostaticus TaxID=67285 RepID=A0A101N3A3_9ACTN|nr:hypothetical protein AQI88_41630 [Streptomyces cellostaticus]